MTLRSDSNAAAARNLPRGANRARMLLVLAGLLASACGGSDKKSADTCTPGSADCACAAGDLCDEGLTCTEGTCGGGSVLSPVSLPAAARSCEVLLIEDGVQVVSVDFGEGTAGTFVREAPRVAIALHASDDSPMGDLTVHMAGDGAAPRAEIAHCVDADGNALDDVELSIGG